MNIETYATITAKVFKPGNHNGGDFPPERIAAMIEAANACAEYINETIESGEYPGNSFQLTKPVPGWINLNHQGFLTETMKNAVKGVTAEFMQEGEWIVAKLKGVKDEIAHFLQAGFPYRSIEIIPELFNPHDGITYKDVTRSVGFLTANPAVPQEPGYAVEFELQKDSPFVLLYSHVDETQNQKGVNIMEENTKQPEIISVKEVASVIQGISVKEYEALKVRQASQEQTIIEMQAKLEADKAEKAVIQERLNKEQTIREMQDIKMYCDALSHTSQASPAFIELISPHLIHADNQAVIEFSSEKTATRREALQELFTGIIDMSKKQALTVSVGAPLTFSSTPHTKETETPQDAQERMISEFNEAAKAKANNPSDEREIYNIALNLALAKYGDALR